MLLGSTVPHGRRIAAWWPPGGAFQPVRRPAGGWYVCGVAGRLTPTRRDAALMPQDNGTSAAPTRLVPRPAPPAPSARRSPAARLRRGPTPAPPALALGALGLVAVVGGCLVAVAVIAAPPGLLSPPSSPGYFPRWLSGPLRDVWPFGASTTTRTRVFDVTIVAMYAAYLVAFVYAPRLRRRWIVAAILAVHVIFLLAPPLPLTDVFNYVNYGRMEIVHSLNPYVTIPALEPHGDPAYALSNWHHLLSPYGPLFTLLTFALVPLGIVVSFWAFKAMLMLASLGSLYLLWRCAELLHRDPARAVVLVGLNPPVLVWGLGGDHNDVLMVLLAMVAVYLLLRARSRSFSAGLAHGARPPASTSAWRQRLTGPAARAGWLHFACGLALVAACAIKLPAALLAPILLVVAPRRRWLAAGMAVGALAVAAASYAAFGANIPDLGVQSNLVTTVGLPNLLGAWIGLGGETAGMRTVLSGVLLAAVGLCALWARRRHGDWIVPAAVAMLVLVVVLSWQAPWYVLWLLPFAALAKRPHLRVATLALGVYMVLAYGSLVNFRPPPNELQQADAHQIQRLVH